MSAEAINNNCFYQWRTKMDCQAMLNDLDNYMKTHIPKRGYATAVLMTLSIHRVNGVVSYMGPMELLYRAFPVVPSHLFQGNGKELFSDRNASQPFDVLAADTTTVNIYTNPPTVQIILSSWGGVVQDYTIMSCIPGLLIVTGLDNQLTLSFRKTELELIP
jgi:hypothetical protein